MIEENGIIVSVDGEHAQVLTQRRSSCGGCNVSGACGTSLLDRLLGRREVRLDALNRTDAKLGDEVVVGVPEEGVLIGSFVAYILPLAGLILGAIVGQTAADSLGVTQQLLSILGGLGGLVVGLGWVRRFGRSSRSDPRFQPVVIRQLRRGELSVSPVAPAEATGP